MRDIGERRGTKSAELPRVELSLKLYSSELRRRSGEGTVGTCTICFACSSSRRKDGSLRLLMWRGSTWRALACRRSDRCRSA